MKVELIYFLIGFISGGFLGVVSMIFMHTSRVKRLNKTLVDLKEQIRTNQYSKPKPRKYRKKT
jgi:hypothetical protein